MRRQSGEDACPQSDKSSDRVSALFPGFSEFGGMPLREPVKSLIIEGVCRGLVLERQNKRIEADEVIVATGGLSYPLLDPMETSYGSRPRQPVIR